MMQAQGSYTNEGFYDISMYSHSLSPNDGKITHTRAAFCEGVKKAFEVIKITHNISKLRLTFVQNGCSTCCYISIHTLAYKN